MDYITSETVEDLFIHLFKKNNKHM